ncbi:hypothetical protein I7F13_04955 [Sinorhizobium meliloti]|nr:hypothetical protein [Sinorhizobium meliloti]AEG09293.1 hypothetical protein SinmeB_5037 [Sinorhizobium meliloti BL225C]MDE3821780.1 hypothetical protein [Sinorhizobium meliloti]MDE4548777.1 hypothetical protein [Sinorhizobium meliloti]MDE4570575.1 hypothetical protein [Sinorhizobium meliloti]SDZ02995.1 hypothetical protein SAMN04244576_04686 [Sinorhizobium meliloti]
MPKSNFSKDPEQLKLKLLGFEAFAVGRFPVTCIFVLGVLVLIGRGFGLW